MQNEARKQWPVATFSVITYNSAQRGESCRRPAGESREAGQLHLEDRVRLQPLSFSTVIAARGVDSISRHLEISTPQDLDISMSGGRRRRT